MPYKNNYKQLPEKGIGALLMRFRHCDKSGLFSPHSSTLQGYWLVLILSLSACGSRAVVQQSPLDTATNHYIRGLAHFERNDLITAQREFDRARMLDIDFPGVYVGYALVAMEHQDFFRSRKELEMAFHKDNDYVDAHIARGRIATREGVIRGEKPDKWLPEALRGYKKARELAPEYPPIHYHLGKTYLQAHNLPLARKAFTRLLEINRGPLVEKAMSQIEQIQMIERAAPGTEMGIKIGLVPEISRAELAVLLLAEMKLGELVEKRRPVKPSNSFQTPTQNRAGAIEAVDLESSWAKAWIEEILELGVPGLELFPDRTFQPDQSLTRANYALVNQGVLILLSGDQDLSTRYIGEATRFPDVRGDFYAYNAISLSTERGLMKTDKRTGHFFPERTVSGAEALLMIREMQNSFRMEF